MLFSFSCLLSLSISTIIIINLLVELTVINGYGRLGLSLLARLALAVHSDLVVDAKLALWHAGQVGLHQDLARHVSGEHLSHECIVCFVYVLLL